MPIDYIPDRPEQTGPRWYFPRDCISPVKTEALEWTRMDSQHLLPALALLTALIPLQAQTTPVLNDREKGIASEMRGLRGLPDARWTKAVAKLAGQIQELPASPGKVALIGHLGNLVTEGDAGHATLQKVASTLADVLRATDDARLYDTLAQLVHYEHCDVSLEDPRYRAALAKLEAEDVQRQAADFTLKDLSGKEWTLKSLGGKVVMVNFWATWCPPCRKEMPDMETLYQRFKSRGLVILAISDEDASKVLPFVAGKFDYPILLDPGRKVHQVFGVEGIPKTFVYDRNGKLVAQAIDRRTERQFLAMLKQAALE